MSDGAAARGARGGVVVITGELDRRRAEALCLEIRALARECGVEIGQIKVVSGPPPPDNTDRADDGA